MLFMPENEDFRLYFLWLKERVAAFRRDVPHAPGDYIKTNLDEDTVRHYITFSPFDLNSDWIPIGVFENPEYYLLDARDP